jgi:hypothetical protein
MQKFRCRSLKSLINLAVKFIAPQSTSTACCTDISKESMRLEILQPIQSNPCGKVSLRRRDRPLEFNVRVAFVRATHPGLEFVCASAAERSQVAQRVTSLTAPQSRPSLVLVRHA